MTRFFSPLHLAAALCFFAVTACSPAGQQLMGDPQNPYPLPFPPQIGAIVHLPTGTVVSPAQMLAVAGDARIVYLGETHDNPASHRLELQVLQTLAELHPGRQALGMEMFVRAHSRSSTAGLPANWTRRPSSGNRAGSRTGRWTLPTTAIC